MSTQAAHLSVCVSICLSGCDVTQMLRLLFPQPPSLPHPWEALTAAVSYPLEKNVPGSHSARPRVKAAAQVGTMCPTGSVTGPPRRSRPSVPPLVLPAAAVAPGDRKAPRRRAWRPGNQAPGVLLDPAWSPVPRSGIGQDPWRAGLCHLCSSWDPVNRCALSTSSAPGAGWPTGSQCGRAAVPALALCCQGGARGGRGSSWRAVQCCGHESFRTTAPSDKTQTASTALQTVSSITSGL